MCRDTEREYSKMPFFFYNVIIIDKGNFLYSIMKILNNFFFPFNLEIIACTSKAERFNFSPSLSNGSLSFIYKYWLFILIYGESFFNV